MTHDTYDRREHWTPTPRPEWVSTLNKEADKLDQRSVIPLSASSLIQQAKENTGLEDFGDDAWQQHLTVLMDAIEGEANLHFAGRILTRSEFVRYLEARLNIIDYCKTHPDIHNETIDQPIIITGYGRSGTTILFELLSQDPQFRVAQKWEALYPCPPPEADSYSSDPRIKKTEDVSEFSEGIIPELQTMHKIAATLPVESVELVYLTFLSEVFTMAFQVPSYARYLATQNLKECFEWQKRILQLLQYRYKKKHWLLKGPSHLPYLSELLEVYPDARIIFTHRDPVVTADSVVSLGGSLYWWRTDKPWGSGSIDNWALYGAEERAEVWNNIIDKLESKAIKPRALSNFHYDQFMQDPMVSVKQIYSDFGLNLSADTEQKMLEFLRSKPKGKFGEHIYTTTPPQVVASERKIYQRYQSYFSVNNEI